MILKIVVCDDELLERRLMEKLLDRFLKERGVEARLEFFASSSECILGHSIRHGDVFVRYNDTQYMALLVGTDIQHAEIAIQRVLNRRSEQDRQRFNVNYEVNSLVS